MINTILSWFGAILKFFAINNNYLIALLLFAVAMKIILLPFSIKQQKNSIRQAKLRPKEMAIRKKYAGRNDKPSQQKLNEEIMKLYQEENFNPASGCLPILLQFPILIGLYQVVIRPLEFFCGVGKDMIAAPAKGAEVGGAVYELVKELNGGQAVTQQINMISIIRDNFDKFKDIINIDKASLPDFTVFGIDLSVKPELTLSFPMAWYLLIPILTFVVFFFGMKITRKFTYNPQAEMTGDAQKSMAIMDWSMPLLSVYICFIMPSIIGIYWIFQNILGTVQQIILAKVMPIPKFTDEDYRRAEKQMNGKIKPEKKQSSGKKVRSLHHIDDEDYVTDEKTGKKVYQPLTTDKPKEEIKGMAKLIDKPELQDDNNEKDNKGE